MNACRAASLRSLLIQQSSGELAEFQLRSMSMERCPR
jgi:hypothetical protein